MERPIGLLAAAVLMALMVVSCGAPEVVPSQATCPVTQPNQGQPPTEAVESVHLGNGLLGTDLWPDGTVTARPEWVQPDGSISIKWPWWRATGTVVGLVEIDGRRLDADAPALRGTSAAEGYGDTGFTPSDIVFPSPGCWEVTGRVGDASLTFVTLVVAP
jgi:hypothetical protein